MIVRFNIDSFDKTQYEYRVTHEGEDLFGDAGQKLHESVRIGVRMRVGHPRALGADDRVGPSRIDTGIVRFAFDARFECERKALLVESLRLRIGGVEEYRSVVPAAFVGEIAGEALLRFVERRDREVPFAARFGQHAELLEFERARKAAVFGDRFFGHGVSGIAVAGVNVSAALAFGPALHLGGGGEGERGGAANFGDYGGANTVAARFAGMNGLGLRAEGAIAAGDFAFHGAAIFARFTRQTSTNMAVCEVWD